MSRIKKLARNPRLLFWARAFTELKTLNAIIVLFYLHRGVTIEEVFYLTLVWSLATLVFEVPSGYLADRIGRKRTMMLGAVILLGAWVSTWFAQGFPAFVGVFVLMSAAASMFSGTEEAFLYDSLKEVGKENEMTKHTGRLMSARHFAKIFLPTIGAFIAKDLIESQFRILIGMDIVAAIIGFIVLAMLIEPKQEKSVAKYEKGIFRESLSIIRGEPFLFRAAMNKVVVFIASIVIWRVYQPLFPEIGLSVLWLGVIYFLLHAIGFSSKWYIEKIEKIVGTVNILRQSVLIVIVSLIIAVAINVNWIIFLAILSAIIFSDVRQPVFAHLMNKRIESRSRATTLSNLNVIKGILDIPILLLAGYLTSINLEYGFILAAALCLIVLIGFPIKESDLKEPAPKPA